MAISYAETFLTNFRVVDYFNDSIGSNAAGLEGLSPGTRIPSFASATVFERSDTHERILAIRGTNNLADWPTDLASILTLGSPKYQLQYTALKEKVIYWISKGVLTPGFTVTGHSLGGFLAAALTADAGPEINHTYLFNAPGFGGFQIPGMARSPNEWLNKLHAGIPGFNDSKITNATAEGSISLISSLGMAVGDRVNIAVETSLQPTLNIGQLYNSHKIETLTDALAVYDLLAKIDPQVTLDTSTAILQAAAPDNHETLEHVLNVLAPPLGIQPTANGDIPRDDLFNKIDQISRAVATSGPFHIISLIDKTTRDVANLAQDDISVRYALKQLDPFALSGRDDLFVQFNGSGQLDLAREDGTGGLLTRQWLADRAELVSDLGWANTNELGDTIQSNTRPARDFVFIAGNGNSETLHIVGSQAENASSNVGQVVFGAAQSDVLTGLDAADHLYGDIGDDQITGGKASDYLEGGPGNDGLNGDAGDDRLVGGTGDDSLDGGAGSDRLEGGPGRDTYLVHAGAGNAVIADSDGLGRILLGGTALTGGAGIRPGEYQSSDGITNYWFSGSLAVRGTLVVGSDLEIQNFRNGDLGITLAPGADRPAPDAGGSLIYLDSPYDQASLSARHPGDPSPHFPWGSPGDDTYIAGPDYGAEFLGRGGDDHLIGGGHQAAVLLGGAGDDWIENREITYIDGDVSRNPHLLAGEAGRDVLYGSVNDEHLFGDFFSASARSVGTSGFRANIDAFRVTHMPTGVSLDPEGYTWSGFGGFWDGSFSDAPDYFHDLTFDYHGPPMLALTGFLGFSAETRPDDVYDDVIDGGGGDDVVTGGPGNDELYGGDGNDRLLGDDGPSGVYYLYKGDFIALGLEAWLDLFGQPGDDIIDGGDGDDEIYDTAGETSVAIGGDGDDVITVLLTGEPGSAWNAVILIDGGDGNDIIDARGHAGEITVDAGAGDDQITALGNFLFIDGGAGSDAYDVLGLDITIHDDDPDTGSIDTLTLRSARDEIHFSHDGDDLVVSSWFDLADVDQVGPDGEEWAEATLRVDDWFAGARHQIEQFVFAPDDGEETVWDPEAIAAALDDGGLAWSDFIEPDTPAFEPIALAPPPAGTPPPTTTPPPPTTSPLPAPEPAEEDSVPAIILPPQSPLGSAIADAHPLRIEITDPGFHGRLDGTAAADTITVLSEASVVIDAGDGDDEITTGGGEDEVRPGPGNDIVSTGGGDDRLIVDRFEGDKRIDAGPGIDILSIDRSIDSISASMEDGRIVIRDAKGGSLAVANANIFELADAVYVLANSESEVITARLYTMWLGRTPDAAGVRYWLDEIAAGRPLADVVHTFAGALYTDAQDGEFLEGFYARAFNRAPDPGEESFWLERLQAGNVTREDIITELAASEEAQLAITGVILIPEMV